MTEDFFFIRPATGEKIHLGARQLPDPRPNIFPTPPKVGLVISTYGGVPLVELALAVRQRLYPDIPALVHDDASPDADRLQSLALRYGADFQCNSSRLSHQMGDLSGLIGGLRWADERGIQLLVKMSRRFIPLINWVPDLIKLAMESQFPTYANQCTHYRFPIRTECIGFHVQDWLAPDVAGEITAFMLSNLTSLRVELYIDDYARKVCTRLCDAARDYERRTPFMRHRLGFAIWDLIGNDRHQPTRSCLWYNANPPEHYAAAARELGLDFGLDAFLPSKLG
jgi:hypothetical protein